GGLLAQTAAADATTVAAATATATATATAPAAVAAAAVAAARGRGGGRGDGRRRRGAEGRVGRSGCRVLPVERRQGRQARRHLEVGAVAPLGCLHVGAPDRPRGGAAEPGRGSGERVPGPDGRRVEGREADEPGVREPLAGAGLAGLRRAAHVGVPGSGAA